jgi:simple sugar transport system substrate-binding protein
MRGKKLWVLVLVLALALFGAACGTNENNGGGDSGDNGSEQSDQVDLTQGGDLTIAMVTHGDGGSFWSVAKKGAEAAAKDLGITLRYSESNNDPEEQAS